MEKFIQQIGKRAGEILLKGFKFRPGELRKRRKGKEVHTEYDFAVEDYLVDEIKRKYPDHSILGEERGEYKKESEFLWIIDPLDGTSNFLNYNPFFSVSIAVLKKNQLYLSYVYAPLLKEIYFAKKEAGAFRNGKKIKISKISDFKKSYLCFCEGREDNKKRVAKIFHQIYPRILGIGKLGSAALECAWVASGRAEGYFSTKIAAWDVAAGALLVQEAGGRVTNFQGKPWQPVQDDFIASNGKIHSKLISLLRNS